MITVMIENISHMFLIAYSCPAIVKAGFKPVRPSMKGSELIDAEIIRNLWECDLVLCDQSILNPNVFFEYGIRTALDKPIVVVADDKTPSRPFDTNHINRKEYSSLLEAWSLSEQIIMLTNHITDSVNKSAGKNALWKYFGITFSGKLNPDHITENQKFDFIIKELEELRMTVAKNEAVHRHQTQETINFATILAQGQAALDRANNRTGLTGFTGSTGFTGPTGPEGFTGPSLYNKDIPTWIKPQNNQIETSNSTSNQAFDLNKKKGKA